MMVENMMAKRLREQLKHIMDEWDKRVRAEVPAAFAQEKRVLRNSLASMMEVLAKVLDEQTEPRTAVRDLAYLTVHGGERAEQPSYSLGEMILECQILQEVVLDTLELHNNVALDERSCIIRYFNELVRVAATEYTRVQQDQIQSHADQLLLANRAKDEFLAMLGHELRNPLGAVSNALYLLHGSAVQGSSSTPLLEIASRQVRHMSKMVDDLLDLARISEGKVVLRTEVVDLGELVEQAVAAVRVIMDARQHTVVVPRIPGHLYVQADPVRIGQCLSNLLTNAAKYTSLGGSITVTVEQRRQEAIVRVRDNGVGIPPELLPHVFDLFKQAHQHLDRSEGGLGIGLTVVKRIVDLHGGRIEVLSNGSGQGSEFILSLPMRDGVPDNTTNSNSSSSSPSLRVLVVEDNADAAEVMRQLLEFWGHEVVVASDGPSALEALRAFSPVVAVIDIGLPGMSGYELARKFREHDGSHSIKLLALTGYAKDLEALTAAGFDSHMLKPVDFQLFREELNRTVTVNA